MKACRDRWTNDLHGVGTLNATSPGGAATSSYSPVAGFVDGWRAKAVRYLPRPIGGRTGANVYGDSFKSVHQRDLRMMKALGINTVIIQQPNTYSVLNYFLDTANDHGLCVIFEFGLWSTYWPRAEGGYVDAYDGFRTVFFEYLQVICRSSLP